MPWKGEKDPYKIWLSEIILQQTRVEQGLKYYENFVEHFPDIKKLAQAPENKVFKLWEGLGYYSRCRNLIATAKYIADEKNGVFPFTYKDILQLKGIGPYTAAAIASFAFNLPHAVIDGNVFRVLSRVFGIKISIDSVKGKKNFTELADELLDKKNPATYNQAIMDFGATVCKPLAPLCFDCIFKKNCAAFNENIVAELPVKEKKLQQKIRYFYFFVIEYKKMIAVRERTEKDIWRHLYEFPLIETAQETDTGFVLQTAVQKKWLSADKSPVRKTEIFTQKLTHQTIKAIFLSVKINKKPIIEGFDWVKLSMLKTRAFPKIINEFLIKYLFEK
jgi:A/G-specific adenine glycosylase